MHKECPLFHGESGRFLCEKTGEDKKLKFFKNFFEKKKEK